MALPFASSLQKPPSRVSITRSCLHGFRLTDPVLNHSTDGIDRSELFVPSPRAPGNGVKSAPGQPSSIFNFFPQSVPKDATTPNIFGHLLVPSQIDNGTRSRTRSPSARQKDRTISPKSESTGPYPDLSDREGIKRMNLGNVSTERTSGLFGSATGSSTGNISGTPSSTPSSGDNAGTKPVYSGLFASKPSVTANNSPFSIVAAKPVFGDTSHTKPSSPFLGNRKDADPKFSFGTAPTTGFGSSSGVATSKTSTGSLFGGITLAKNDDILK